jgi:chromosome segregation ATPase
LTPLPSLVGLSVFQLALSQKQLKAADDQISELKQRLLTIRESHDDIKEDYAKVSKEVSPITRL